METQPPPMIPDAQAMRDAEHIRLLAVFHYVLAGLHVVMGCLMAAYFVFFIVMMNTMTGVAASSPSASGSPPPTEIFEMMSWFYGVFGGIGVLIAVGMAWVQFLAGRNLSARRYRTFIFVVACFQCLSFPFGTALGVFTLVVLERPSVKRMFDQPDTALGSFG